MTEYTISEHCKQRYAERMMEYDKNSDIKFFIIRNEDKIQKDVNKLINYGDLIFSGSPSNKAGKGNIVDVYLNGTWIVLVDNQSKNAITLYKIDLGLDDEFNMEYVSKMIEKLDKYKEILNNTQREVQEESDMYQGMVDDFETQIKEYRTMINNLEELCAGYRTVIKNNRVKVAQAENDVAEVVNTLVGKREF